MARKNKTQLAVDALKLWLKQRDERGDSDGALYPHCIGEGVTYRQVKLILHAAEKWENARILSDDL